MINYRTIRLLHHVARLCRILSHDLKRHFAGHNEFHVSIRSLRVRQSRSPIEHGLIPSALARKTFLAAVGCRNTGCLTLVHGCGF